MSSKEFKARITSKNQLTLPAGIGAHACAVGALVARDADFYRRAFPDLRVLDMEDYSR